MTPKSRNKEIDAYIEALPAEQRPVVARLRELIHEAAPGCLEAFKWSRPIFGNGKDFAYLKANKNHVNLGFNKGSELEDPEGLLEGTGKGMRHVKVKDINDIPEEALFRLIREAAVKS